jgi:hypothetical protein
MIHRPVDLVLRTNVLYLDLLIQNRIVVRAIEN